MRSETPSPFGQLPLTLISNDAKVHGLIFLFPYGTSDAIRDDDDSSCPKHVWFANQVTLPPYILY
jgi:hypothetical protein